MDMLIEVIEVLSIRTQGFEHFFAPLAPTIFVSYSEFTFSVTQYVKKRQVNLHDKFDRT